ncbi:MAG: cytochrome c3 family protein [Chloroflexota bacterium]
MRKRSLDYALKYRLPVALFIVAASFALTFYVSRSERDGIGYAPGQPINFSHRLHAGQMAIDCKYCHTAVEKGRHAGIPSADVCMNCHSYARKDKPEIKKLYYYYNAGKPIPWKRVHQVPRYAYFNHSRHVNKGMQCYHCHDRVEWMEVVKQAKGFTMGDCVNCHRNAKEFMPEIANSINLGPTHCNTCHR